MGCFSSRARRLLHLHLASSFQRYLWRIKHFFADDHEAMIREGRHLVSYVAMNAIAIRKILKKYDKVSSGETVSFILQMFVLYFIQKDFICYIITTAHFQSLIPSLVSLTLRAHGGRVRE